MGLSRREVLALALALPGSALLGCDGADSSDGWNRGPVRHLLPTASGRSLHLKLSLVAPLSAPPRLSVGGQTRTGERLDSAGRFWAFRVGGLAPDTEYRLELAHGQEPLCDPWPLRTLPARDAQPSRLRIASFTCAGGANLPTPPSVFHAFKPAAWRRRLFDLMLAGEPDLVIANGDHVYFDLPQMDALRDSTLGRLILPFVDGAKARFDPTLAVLGTANETALTMVGDDQIASIYGVRFRSTPIFFVTDDHDYFVNDDATLEGTTLPPSPFHAALRDTLQRLYFPEFIADDLPTTLPGRLDGGRAALSTHFGEIRYGDLFEGLLYDCGGFLSLGAEARLVPRSVEAWLLDRTRNEDTLHLAHIPSHPMGWTAGKWREWYPDQLDSTGAAVAPVLQDEAGGKYLWQQGWWRQHQALLEALASQSRRKALVVSGDLHALGAARIDRSGGLDLEANPVHAILSGPVGVGDVGWPSRARGVSARTPDAIGAESLLDLEERNGFTVMDFDRGSATVRIFGCPPDYTAPANLTVAPAFELELA